MNISASVKHPTFVTKLDELKPPCLHLVKETGNNSQCELELQLEAIFSSNGLVADIKLENH